MTQHIFAKSIEELKTSLQVTQVEQNSPANNSAEPVTTTPTGEEGGATTEAFDNSENGGTSIATTQALGEEGGFSEPIPTTEAIGEEGGNLPIPTTATLGAEAGITPIPLPPQVVTTQAVGEEGGFAPEPTPTTLAVGEEGGDFATTLAVGEEGGDFATTLALGEEGGDFATTLALGEEGGFPDPFGNSSITQPGSEAGVVTTLALGEEGGNFNEEIYRQTYPAVDAAINRGEFNSGLEHYIQFGQFEIERIGFFTGTNGNDIITAFGNNTRIIGVNTLGYNPVNDEIIPNSFGVGEIDILVGSSRAEIVDQFILGSSQGLPFYAGFGNSDFALIQNFDVAFDQIHLPGTLADYSAEIINNSVNISTLSGDLIAIIEDVPSLDNLMINLI
ncbi:MAG: hypothetical protein AAGJ08_26560 [Cyanobacteria bacterium P01_H01_bin.35]